MSLSLSLLHPQPSANDGCDALGGSTRASEGEWRQLVDSLRQDLEQAHLRHGAEQERRIRSEMDAGALMAQVPFGLVTLHEEQVLACNAAATDLLPGLRPGGPFALPADWQRRGDTSTYHTGRGADARVMQVDWLSAPNLPTQWVRLEDVTASQNERDTSERQSRLAAMGRMTAELAHQLRTPLCTATLYASMLSDSALNSTDHTLIVQRLLSQLGQLDALIVRMLAFVKTRSRSHEVCAIEPLLRAQLDVVIPLMAQRGRVVRVDWSAPDCLVAVDQMQLGSALLALLENALQHAPAGSQVDVGCVAHGHRVEITVADQGPGVSELLLPRLFEPFATDHPTGTGLGLAIARAAAESHGGKLSYQAVQPQGACFKLTLPALPQV